MSEPFIAEIVMFGGNFAPRQWAFCNGQLLPISQNTALFSLLGTTYGGDGRTTFALPEMRGRVPVHSGNGSAGPGLTPRPLGQRGGEENHTLNVNEIPSHNHPTTLHGELGAATATTASGNLLANGNQYAAHNANNPEPAMAPQAIVAGNTGGGQSHNNMQPYIAINYIIALQGIFPSRS